MKANILYRIGLGALVIGGLSMAIDGSAQGPAEAYRLGQQGIHGTARAQGLGGAVGAIGADPSAIYVNPAGIGFIFRNQFSITANPGWATNSVRWSGYNSTENAKTNYSQGSFSNISYLTPLFQEGNTTLNFGAILDQSFNFKRNYQMITGPLGSLNGYIYRGADLADYMAARANTDHKPYSSYLATDTYNPFSYPVDPLVTMGVNSNFIEGFSSSDPNQKTEDFRSSFSQSIPDGSGDSNHLFELPAAASLLSVQESGSRTDMDINLGGNIGDYFYWGGSLRFGSSVYNRQSSYRQDYHWTGPDYKDLNKEITNESYMELGNTLSSKGISVGLNLGALLAIGDYGRIGISYLTPQIMSVEELYSSSAISKNGAFKVEDQITTYNTDEMQNDYKMILPGQLTVSAMAFLSKYGLLSYDLQYRNLGSTKLLDDQGNRKEVTKSIPEDYGAELTHRFGIEIRPTSRLMLRAGYSVTGNPMISGQFKQQPPTGIDREYFITGTTPDFVLPRSYQSYSAGIGYHLTRSISVDLSYVQSIRKEKVYAFPGMTFSEGGQNFRIRSFGGDMKDIKNDLLITLTLSH